MSPHNTGNRSYAPPRQGKPLRLRDWLQGLALACAFLFLLGYLDGREQVLDARLAAAQAAAQYVVTTQTTHPQGTEP